MANLGDHDAVGLQLTDDLAALGGAAPDGALVAGVPAAPVGGAVHDLVGDVVGVLEHQRLAPVADVAPGGVVAPRGAGHVRAGALDAEAVLRGGHVVAARVDTATPGAAGGAGCGRRDRQRGDAERHERRDAHGCDDPTRSRQGLLHGGPFVGTQAR